MNSSLESEVLKRLEQRIVLLEKKNNIRVKVDTSVHSTILSSFIKI